LVSIDLEGDLEGGREGEREGGRERRRPNVSLHLSFWRITSHGPNLLFLPLLCPSLPPSLPAYLESSVFRVGRCFDAPFLLVRQKAFHLEEGGRKGRREGR